MARNGHFFIVFWHFRLQPYFCCKRETLGFFKQATHWRPGDEPFFTLVSTVQDWNGPKMVYFGPKWPTVAGLSKFQSGPKGTKMVNLCFWPFGPLWIISDKIEFFAPNWLLKKQLYSPLRYQFQQIYQGTVWQLYNLYKTFQMRGYVK